MDRLLLARRRETWPHTAQLTAAMLNTALGAKRVTDPADVNPYPEPRPPAKPADLSDFMALTDGT
jgi:hypothetical protein